METKTKPLKRTHCPGSDRKITQQELNDTKHTRDKWGYPVTRYKCKDCGKYYTKQWGGDSFTRHGFKLDEAEKEYRKQEKIKKELAELEKKRKKAEEAEQRRIDKLILEGKVCFCAECDGYILDTTDYLCAECRSNM
jgi:hypothetical protein